MSRNSDIAKILGRTEAVNVSNTPLGTGDGGHEVYATPDLLPTTGLTSGDQAFVTGNQRLYITNGSGWYNVALVNATPTLTISPSGAIALETDGSTPTIITLTGTDSDNADANLTYTVESDGSFANIATLSQDSSVFTITPLAEGSATAGSSTLTFKVSDGISFGSGTTAFSLAFTTDWATASTTLTVIDGFDNNDKFGRGHSGLNTDGTYFVVGAAGDDTDHNQRGVANVYYYNGSSWGLQTALAPPNADKKAELNFGSCCDIDGDGDTVVVSASNYGTYTGAIWVYTRSGTTWTYRTKLTASDGANYDQLGGDNNSRGLSISKDGAYIIAGARQDDDGGSNNGSAYIYTGSGASWSQQQRIVPSSYSGTSNQFGFAVDINNDGTYCAVSANTMGFGKVFIYTRSGSTWTEQASVTASDGASADNYGWHISMNGAGDRLLVYAKYDDDNYDSSGSIYVYTRSGSTWTQTAKLVKGDPTTSGFYYDYWGKCTLNEAGDIFVTHGHGPGDTTAGAGRIYVWKDNSSGTDGTSWSLIKTLNTTVSETYGLGAHDGFTMISGDGSVIANTSGRAPNNDEQGKAYVFNT
jgi:hypothetical protein